MNAIAKTWTACVSALQLDRLRMGEAVDGAVRAHVAGCEKCTRALEELRLDEPLPPLRVVPLRRNAWPRVVAGLSVAAAASVLLVLWPSSGVRTKGDGGPSLGMYVRHLALVRRVGPGEAVAAGDAIRFAVTMSEPKYVAILSVDPRGKASVYVPPSEVRAGSDVPLPIATRLDATAGEERIVGVFCERPFDAEALRAALEQGNFSEPDGCKVVRWSFVKR
ncbi:MAG: DUF4384 domain-containing protein [Myxococcales bacterium]|nr:DUF4384 domain-containing protein [Myxococcales bacterium]